MVDDEVLKRLIQEKLSVEVPFKTIAWETNQKATSDAKDLEYGELVACLKRSWFPKIVLSWLNPHFFEVKTHLGLSENGGSP